MFDGLQKFGGFLRLFIPSDMFKRRDADNEIVFPGRHKLDDVLIDDPRGDLIFVDDIVMNRKVMSQHVPNFKNPLALMTQEKFAENRDLDATFVFPGFVIEVIEIAVLPPIKDKRLASYASGQRHLDESPVASGGAFVAGSGSGVIVCV